MVSFQRKSGRSSQNSGVGRNSNGLNTFGKAPIAVLTLSIHQAVDHGETVELPRTSRSTAAVPPYSRVYHFFSSPWLAFGVPFVFLGIATMLLRFTDLDVRVMRLFFDASTNSWPLSGREPWLTIYKYGTLPGWTLGIGAMALWLIRFRRRDRAATLGAFCALTVLLGPGLFVNTVLKPHFHRPRPNQLVCFGGGHAFAPVLVPSGTDETRSFPSGHASMGFYLMTPAFLFLRRKPRRAIVILLVGMSAGGLLGLTRIVQGRHFPSDILWAWAVVYYSSLSVYYALGLPYRDALGESFNWRGGPDGVVVEDDDWGRDNLEAGTGTLLTGESTRRSAA